MNHLHFGDCFKRYFGQGKNHCAQNLNRKWLGADISHLAIRLIVKPLIDSYGKGVKHNVKIHGFLADVGRYLILFSFFIFEKSKFNPIDALNPRTFKCGLSGL